MSYCAARRMHLQSQIVILEKRLADLKRDACFATLVNKEHILAQLLTDTEYRLYQAQKELAHLGDCGD